MVQTYQGYFQSGRFMPFGSFAESDFEDVAIPDDVEAYVIVTGKALSHLKSKSQKQLAAFEQFITKNKEITDEPFTEEFDAIIQSGINIGGELEL